MEKIGLFLFILISFMIISYSEGNNTQEKSPECFLWKNYTELLVNIHRKTSTKELFFRNWKIIACKFYKILENTHSAEQMFWTTSSV